MFRAATGSPDRGIPFWSVGRAVCPRFAGGGLPGLSTRLARCADLGTTRSHLTRPDLRSWAGLNRIWFHFGATSQYYPLLHTAFWLEHKLWGDATLGYHLLNLLLHAMVALMVALALRRLAVPGAYLAAALFALHPVHVESAAWITEQKNTLSGAFYLGSLLMYLRFDRTRKLSWYLGALALFTSALLSKTVTATLPGAVGGFLVAAWPAVVETRRATLAAVVRDRRRRGNDFGVV